jgi:hypothetical protein
MHGWVYALAVVGVTACGGSGAHDPGASNEPVDTAPAPSSPAGGVASADAAATPPPPSLETDASPPAVDSGSATMPPPDAAASPVPEAGNGDVTVPTSCGAPGDVGNSLGVGAYCTTSAQCASNSQATLCATLGNPNMQFCTFLCSQGNATGCGTGASCECQAFECGCVPDSCL